MLPREGHRVSRGLRRTTCLPGRVSDAIVASRCFRCRLHLSCTSNEKVGTLKPPTSLFVVGVTRFELVTSSVSVGVAIRGYPLLQLPVD